MTVLGLVPTRILSSGRKRGAVVRSPFNNIRPYRPVRPGDPVPEPLPPAPLLGLPTLLALGGLVLAQFWGRSNAPTGIVDPYKPISYSGAGIYAFYVTTTRTGDGQMCSTKEPWTENTVTPTTYDFGIATNKILSVKYTPKAIHRVLMCTGSNGPSQTVHDFEFVTQLKPGETQSSKYGSFTSPAVFGIAGSESILGALTRATRDGVDLPLPKGYQPGVKPQIEVEPKPVVVPIPWYPKRPDPFAPLVPDAEPAAVPEEPGPKRPPAAPPIPAAPVFVPIRPPGSAPMDNGKVVPPKPAPIPVTPSDVVFPVPGGKPVGGPGQSPKPDLVGIAQEVGRIERKMEGLLNPQGDGNPLPEWLDRLDDYWDAFQQISDLLTSIGAGGEYLMREPCDPEGDGVFVERRVPYAGALGPLGVIENKIDALAELMQAAKDLRQPVCPPPASTGEGVTVRFASLLTPPGDSQKLQKLLRYRDQSGAPLEVHHDHWKDFTWTSGPVFVKSTGMPWGKPQVWAVSAEEGKRVLAHAAAVAGVSLSDPRHKWDVRVATNPRYGRSEHLEVKHLNLGLRAITKRRGPDGPIWVVAEVPVTQ